MNVCILTSLCWIKNNLMKDNEFHNQNNFGDDNELWNIKKLSILNVLHSLLKNC